MGSASGVGHPDARTGHGYGSARGGPGNRTYPLQRGFPYDELDLEPDRWDSDEDWDVDDLDDEALRVSHDVRSDYLAHDTMGMHARDRRSYADSSTFRTPMYSEGAVNELSATIRTRSKSSEPGVGTIYGWSSQPMWDDPPRRGGVERPRFEDVVGNDEEDDFADDVERVRRYMVDEALIRRFVSRVLVASRRREGNFSAQRR